MKNKKGFTLIELLAVLVVLAILALISIPITIRIINQSRENSYKRSIESYGKAVESYIGKYLLTNDINYKNIKLDDIKDEVKYNGSKVSCRKLKFKDNGDIVLTGCTVNEIDYYKYEDRHVTKEKDKYDVGDVITINEMNFYVINDYGDYVTALKETPLTVEEVNLYGGVGTANNHVNQSGSLSIYGRAYDWGDDNHSGGIAFSANSNCGFSREEGCIYSYDQSDIKYVVDAWAQAKFPNNELEVVGKYDARLITLEELTEYLGVVSTSNRYQYHGTEKTPGWLFNGYRWWTMTSEDLYLFYLDNDGYSIYGSQSYYVFALRPVINVKKSTIE